MSLVENSRKSLMVSQEAHARITQIAEKHGVSQPEMVEALLSCVDEIRLSAALAERIRKREAAKIEEEKKTALLKRALSSMSVADLENLLKDKG